MLKKRRHDARKAADLARLLIALDALAADTRGWRAKRTLRGSFGATARS